jgi:hypothetical protein
MTMQCSLTPSSSSSSSSSEPNIRCQISQPETCNRKTPRPQRERERERKRNEKNQDSHPHPFNVANIDFEGAGTSPPVSAMMINERSFASSMAESSGPRGQSEKNPGRVGRPRVRCTRNGSSYGSNDRPSMRERERGRVRDRQREEGQRTFSDMYS